jgi:hypothetical protein
MAAARTKATELLSLQERRRFLPKKSADKTHLALVAPTTVIGVRHATPQEMRPQTNQSPCPMLLKLQLVLARRTFA